MAGAADEGWSEEVEPDETCFMASSSLDRPPVCGAAPICAAACRLKGTCQTKRVARTIGIGNRRRRMVNMKPSAPRSRKTTATPAREYSPHPKNAGNGTQFLRPGNINSRDSHDQRGKSFGSSLDNIPFSSLTEASTAESPITAISSARVNSEMSNAVTSGAMTKSAGFTPTAFMLRL